MQNTKFEIELDKKRYMEFTWASIDYISERNESFGECALLVGLFDGNPMNMTKKTMNALYDMLTALFITDDPSITPEIIKQIMPMNKMTEISALITSAVQAGSVVQTNP